MGAQNRWTDLEMTHISKAAQSVTSGASYYSAIKLAQTFLPGRSWESTRSKLKSEVARLRKSKRSISIEQRDSKHARIEQLLSIEGWKKVKSKSTAIPLYQPYEKRGVKGRVYLGNWFIEASWQLLACDYQNSLETWVLAYIDPKYQGAVDTIMDEEFERRLSRDEHRNAALRERDERQKAVLREQSKRD